MKRKTPDPKTVKYPVGEVIAHGVTVGPDVKCPRCGVLEVEDNTKPINEWVWNIRPNKVCDEDDMWWSQCMVCRRAGRESWFCY
jgi:hypothetical protein